MSVSSMTGFARAEGADERYGWSWEIRSVNARNLDVRLRLPSGFDRLDPRARAAITGRFTRGNISASLTLARTARTVALTINREALDQVLALAEELKHEVDAAPPRIDGLLGVRGVLEQAEDDATSEEREALENALVETLGDGLDALVRARAEEGTRLETVIGGHFDQIARLVDAAGKAAEAQPKAINKRLREQVRDLVKSEPKLSEERLAQEVALLAAKADVREELDRLIAHVEAARELASAGGAIGRRLDFLCQEFNREANTLCSKAAEIELTRIGLDLKASIEQLREQVQNIE